MQKNWKNVLPFALTTLVAFTGVVSANADNAQTRNLENRVSALEQRKEAGGMINPQGRPQVRNGVDMFIFADLLYWNTHEEGLDLAVKQSPIAASDEVLSNATIKTMHGKWNWGFRTGLGYNSCHDGWDVKLTWLRYTDTGHSAPKTGVNDGFYPVQMMAAHANTLGPERYAEAAKGYWSMNLNQLDLDLGREFFVSKWLTLRPHMGLRTDWIHQKFHTSYHKLDYPGVGPGERLDARDELKDHWWGIGLQGGVDTQWGLGSGWSLFGNFAAAIRYGIHEMDVDHYLTTTSGNVATTTTMGDIKQGYRMSHSVLDAAMGIRWDYLFSNDRFHIGFDLGWEHHVFFSQNQFPLFVDDYMPGQFVSNHGDMTTQGWTFSARFDF